MTNKEILFHLVYTFLWGSLMYLLAGQPFTPLTVVGAVFALGCMALQLNYLITEAAERF